MTNDPYCCNIFKKKIKKLKIKGETLEQPMGGR